MNFKKKLREIAALTRKPEGFTLVELIVVIAILGILGGVGTVGYSGYIKKANMTADQTLISEIEQALTLAYYNQDFTEGNAGYIMLSPIEGQSMPDSMEGATAQAMKKVFGDNWLDSMQLKYSDWGVSWTTMSYDDATSIVNSSFATKFTPDELMEQVQYMTYMANGLKLNAGETEVSVYDLFDYTDSNGVAQNAIIDAMKEYGLGESVDDWNDDEKISSAEKSNLLVLAVADSVNKGYENCLAASIIPTYALYVAYTKENDTVNDAYETFKKDIDGLGALSASDQYDAIKKAYNDFENVAIANGVQKWRDEEGNGTPNTNAFNAIMAGVGSAMNENGDNIIAQLDDPNMFTTGVGYDMYNDYLNAAYATNEAATEFLGIQGTAGFEGTVLIQYTVSNGVLHIAKSLPDA